MPIRYMHTLNGEPAGFDGTQVSFRWNRLQAIPLCESLKELRRQQRKTIAFRRQNGLRLDHRYGYVRVRA